MNPSNIRLISPTSHKTVLPPNMKPSKPALVSPVNSQQLSMKTPQNQLIQVNKPKNEGDHGLICTDGCVCPVMNGATISDKVKTQLWAYMKRCLKITNKVKKFKKNIFSGIFNNFD